MNRHHSDYLKHNHHFSGLEEACSPVLSSYQIRHDLESVYQELRLKVQNDARFTQDFLAVAREILAISESDRKDIIPPAMPHRFMVKQGDTFFVWDDQIGHFMEYDTAEEAVNALDGIAYANV